MRLFLDANIMTYIAFFEGYLLEGTPAEHEAAIDVWIALQHSIPNTQLLAEIEALRLLYLIDDQARFDWLFSDVAAAEIGRIRDKMKRIHHRGLLDRLIEHRFDVYAEEGTIVVPEERAALLAALFPGLPAKLRDDALQYCEALLVEADYFVTNDQDFAALVTRTDPEIPALKVSDLPFVARLLL